MTDEKKLRIASHALHYEITMLYSLDKILATASTQDSVEYRAALESFCLHFRNLAEFFSLSRGSSDKAVARHFVRDWNTRTASMMWNKYKKRVNQEITHLTYKRLQAADGDSWDFSQMTREMKQLVDEFTPRIPQQRKGSQWQDPPRHRPPTSTVWIRASTHSS